MKLRILSFTDRGQALAERIAAAHRSKAERCPQGGLAEWTKIAFAEADAILFVGAAGIAVRAIAPFAVSKTTDPAVIVIDEQGTFVIPILSGHIGGANRLAGKLAKELHAVPVITTATDRNRVFAVDVWATRQGCAILNPEKIKAVSGALLRGETVRLWSEFEISGRKPKNITEGTPESCSIAVTVQGQNNTALLCVPKAVVLGIGCKRGTTSEQLEEQLKTFLNQNNILGKSIYKVCSIDRKADEPGLQQLCADHGWPLETFSAKSLEIVSGNFHASGFVRKTVGVDNVCERSAVLGSGGTLVAEKYAGNGVTLAAAVKPLSLNWRR